MIKTIINPNQESIFGLQGKVAIEICNSVLYASICIDIRLNFWISHTTGCQNVQWDTRQSGHSLYSLDFQVLCLPLYTDSHCTTSKKFYWSFNSHVFLVVLKIQYWKQYNYKIICNSINKFKGKNSLISKDEYSWCKRWVNRIFNIILSHKVLFKVLWYNNKQKSHRQNNGN